MTLPKRLGPRPIDLQTLQEAQLVAIEDKVEQLVSLSTYDAVTIRNLQAERADLKRVVGALVRLLDACGCAAVVPEADMNAAVPSFTTAYDPATRYIHIQVCP